VVKAELEAAGFKVDTAVVDDPTSAAASGDFDLFLWAQHTAPSGDPALFFNSMLRTGAALNYGGYSNPTLDKVIDRFATEADPQKRAATAAEAETIVFKDAPILYLVSPDWFVGVSKRLADYQPWGSDYHVLRADIGELN
jgi:peptide/nickel transport system substrate-binding protein